MTLDERAILRLTARRASIVDIAKAKIVKLDAAKMSIAKEAQDTVAKINAEIALINSAPRYARPKKKRAKAFVDPEFDQELADKISAARAAVVVPTPLSEE